MSCTTLYKSSVAVQKLCICHLLVICVSLTRPYVVQIKKLPDTTSGQITRNLVTTPLELKIHSSDDITHFVA